MMRWILIRGHSLEAMIVAVFITVSLLSISAVYLLYRYSIVPELLHLERQYSEHAVNQVGNAFEAHLTNITQTTQDWAHWDDSYQFIQGNTPDPEYVKSNLVTSTFIELGYDIITFFNEDGEPFWHRQIERSNGKLVTNRIEDAGWLSNQLKQKLLSSSDGDENNFSGFLRISDGRILVMAVSAILTSEGEGPVEGYLLMGRWLDSDLLDELSRLTRLRFKVHDENALARRDLSPELEHSADHYHSVLHSASDPDTLLIYLHIPLLNRQEYLLLELSLERTIMQASLRSMKQNYIGMVFGTITLFIALFIIFRLMVIAPLKRLTRHISNVDDFHEDGGGLETSRRDEIGILHREYLCMMARLRENGRSIEALNRELIAENCQRREVEVQLRDINQRLRELSLTDGLTGIANRRAFNEALEREWHRGQRTRMSLSLLIFDIDFFKRYNDGEGHPRGDECLIKIAQLAASAVSRSSDLVCRYGGEEFAVLLPDTDGHGAVSVAERICNLLKERNIPHQDSPFGRVTVSLGVGTTIPDMEDDNYSAFLSHCDKALYEAKREGRNRLVQFSSFEPVSGESA